MTYDSYKSDMKRFKQVPMSEEQFNLMMNIGEERIEPLVITPKNQQKPMKPTIENHDKVKPIIKRIRLSRAKENPQPKKNNGTDLSGLSAEQKRAYHNDRALKKYHANKSPNVRVKMSEEERKKKRYEYEKSRREKMKAEGTWYRKPPTEEQKQKVKDYKTMKRREQGILPRTKMGDEEKRLMVIESNKRWRAKCKTEGKKRVLTDEQRERYNANYRAKAKLKKELKNATV